MPANRVFSSLNNFFSRLYVRIWLAVVLTVLVLTVVFGAVLRANMEQQPVREVVVRDESGQVVGQASTRGVRVPGQGLEFQVAMKDGRNLSIQVPPRPRSPGEPPPARPWVRGPQALLWLMLLVGLAVALGSYPVVRHLTLRLEKLRLGVERFGAGDLRARVDATGSDEVAFLATRFNQAADRIEGLMQAHKSLLANASHELRSPLARIRMGIELLAGPGTASGAGSEHTRSEINRCIAELDQLIDEILLASRLDAAQINGTSIDVGSPEPVDLIALAAEECARAGAQLQCRVQSLTVQGTPRLLRRLLRNLLENASRYGGGQPVTVELDRSTEAAVAMGALHPASAWAVVRVCDSGPGVPLAERNRIFEPFYRLQSASERAGGVGLGLALVRSIAQRHGGQVVCQEHLPHGACFLVTLPL